MTVQLRTHGVDQFWDGAGLHMALLHTSQDSRSWG